MLISLPEMELLITELLSITLDINFSKDNNIDVRKAFSSLSLQIASSCLRMTDTRSFCLDRRESISDTKSLLNLDSKLAIFQMFGKRRSNILAWPYHSRIFPPKTYQWMLNFLHKGKHVVLENEWEDQI